MLMSCTQLQELLGQALETELSGVKVYETALTCVVHGELKDDWRRFLDETEHHVEIVRAVIDALGLDPDARSPRRLDVHRKGCSLVEAMEKARDEAKDAGGAPEAAELVAAECVVQAETKDHLDWTSMGEAARALGGDEGRAVREALAEVEARERAHLCHMIGWCRELWLAWVGLPAVLPPPEADETAIGAAGTRTAGCERL